MENEKQNQLPEEIQPDLTPELSEADLEAQKWLEELLAATAPAEAPNEEPAETNIEFFQEEVSLPEETPAAEMPQEPEWFQELEAPAEAVPSIGTDEQAVSQHEMTDIADMELDKIMQEAMSDDWNIAAIESEVMAQAEAEFAPLDSENIYTDDGIEPEPEDDDQLDTKRKVRPKRKTGYGLFGLPHLVSTLIWAIICIAIGTSLGRILWLCAADILAFGRPDQEVVITITAEDNLDTITDKLHNSGLIQYKDLFKFYANLTDVMEEGKISTGTFTLNTLYDYHALVGGLSSTSSYRETIEVVIPEGYTCAQIFALLEERGVCSAQELETYCETSQFSSYWFLEDVEKGTKYCLEGFLFPDTYEFYTNSSAKMVFITMLNGFSNHFGDDVKAQLDALNVTLEAKYAANGASASFKPLTVKDIVIIASMIEKETAYSGESPTIASVIYNRLSNPANYPYLNIDATIVYAQGGSSDKIDTSLDHPYNTYKYKGLPPGPISNPGANSLKATLNPQTTGYYFYVLDPTAEVRSHKFFKTYKEHQAFLDSLR